MLFPLFPPPLTAVAAAVFAIFFLASFTWDWLLVSGVVPRAPAAWTNRSRSGLPALQVALRIGLLTLAVIFTLQSLENSSPAVIALSLLQLLAAGLVFLGIASRISSGVALILIGLGQMLASPGDLQVIQVIAYSTIIFIGSGPYSLWLLEESWFERPAHQPGQAEMNRSQRETLPQTASKA
jgi:hypothetical protein